MTQKALCFASPIDSEYISASLHLPLLIIVVLFLWNRYDIMRKCWEEQPTDRPTFDKLRKTMKQMEKNHKVRVQGIFKDEEILFP